MNRSMNVVRGTAAAATAAVLTALLAAPAAQAAPGTRTLYAAPAGHGTSCTVARPCTPEAARDLARTVTGREVRVLLEDGTYRLDEPLKLGSADSGVTWAAAPGAHPVLSGGQDITGWRQNADGTWSARVPEGVTPRQLFVDGRRATRARGEACAAATCDATKAGMTGATATGIDRWQRPTDAEAVIRVRWRNYHCRIAAVSGDTMTFAQPCWTNSASGTDRTGPAWDSTTVDSTRYSGVAFFENALELLDQPGEFVWNSTDRTVTYLPRKGENMRHAQAVTPHTEQLLVVDGAHDVTVDGIGFAYAAYRQPGTDEGYAGMQAGLTLTGATGPVDHAGRFYTKPAAAVTVRGGRGVSIGNTRFTHLGGAGAVLEAGTKDSSVTRSSFTDLSSGAVYVGDTEPMPGAELTGERNTVAYNTISRTGVEYTDAVGIWAGYEAELTVDHNSLDHLPYSGISVGWGWNQTEAQKSVLRDNKVTNNRITDVMEVARQQHDGGAIYTQGAQPGTVLSGNYINRSAYGNTERDGNGIYLDEQSSHITVEKNVITRIGYKWVSNWADYGIENTARHNWTDTAAPALGGRGSVMTDNLTGLDRLPAEALAVAARAGSRGGPVEQLRTDLARTGTATQSSTDATATAELALDADTNTDTRTLSEAGAWWQVDLGGVRHVRQVEVWNNSASVTGDFDIVTDSGTVHVSGKALRPTVIDLDSRTRTLKIVTTGTGRVALSQVLIHS
ncbi:right-handed parallel beta-helix repeat-containing protein [Streptomyces sp. P01-B04]|uniref:Right-handed parallel beta-helix repeat-containing protein n=1 Tax=Streptomyces poriferorum TaxID=2798799 RepID=A0ABY9IKN2_9ACTN|nr:MULTISPECIES: right-handed parallel beta-helix repeat-containing protein [Streptomyces]MBW5250782.1 right-handed parallel beta-helix repeat-containing protein [Streptomyces poriferorum]MBW5259086.1 right-handed parallel beta-helix repeat-containing protein [Streptomyces poriferorum]MDP5316430.1 right-handed parallel beta-helix repeat-containing protein [Streptomyces sp. Alt4]WLQ54748.1 right-handed parallel beta-helix repeat-containing protein [Streptomyces sp. Alt2]